MIKILRALLNAGFMRTFMLMMNLNIETPCKELVISDLN